MNIVARRQMIEHVRCLRGAVSVEPSPYFGPPPYFIILTRTTGGTHRELRGGVGKKAQKNQRKSQSLMYYHCV